MTTWHDFVLPTLVLLPLAGALVLLFVGARAERWAVPFTVAVQGAGLLVSLVLMAQFDRSQAFVVQFGVATEWVPQLDLWVRLGVDGISLPLVLLTSLLGFLTALYSLRHLPAPRNARSFMGLLLLLQVGMIGTFLALDLLLFFVFFEVVLIPMWFLIAQWGSGEKRRAANTFILFTVLGSVVMLVGFLLIWAQTGTTDIVELVARGGAGMSSGVQLAVVLLVGLGLLVKAPMWPLHSWLPDAHTAAPTVGSVLLAGVLLKMGTYGLIRIAVPVVPQGAQQVAPYLGAFAVVGILYGAWASYGQRDLKRLIAFSSVGHMGFVLLGIATMSVVGINAALFGNVAHGLITGLLFFVVGGLKDRFHTSALADLPRGLYASLPRLGFLLGFAAVASLGLPGLAGFWGEFLSLVAAYRPAVPEVTLFRVLMVLAALGTVLTAAYFLKVLRQLGQGEPTDVTAPDLTRLEAATWLPLAALIVVLGLFPGVLLSVTGPAVSDGPMAPASAPGGDG
ncbi:MAG: NADH-quinone oxidoreductase subunit M [Actinomycetota bacterium]|nr:NADH-quinone oxidoreductase subunit M [Actinomycetota bacterium]